MGVAVELGPQGFGQRFTPGQQQARYVQKSDFDLYVLTWFSDIRNSVSLGAIEASPAPVSSPVGRNTDHIAALAVLNAALEDEHSDGEKNWRILQSDLEENRKSSRKLFR